MPDEPINLDELFDDIPDTEPEFEDPDLVTDFTNTPFTQEEYNWFVGRKICSVELLTHFVYNPIHFQDGYGDDAIDCRPYWDDRTSLERDEIKQLSDWNKTVGLVQHYLNVVTPGEATKYAQQFTGRAKKGEWKDWNIKPALNVIELCAFLHWLSEMKARDPQFRPKKPEKLFMLVEEFRALPNHFEHVNYARYQIKQVFPKPQEPVEIDLTLGPEDEMKKLSEQFEAEFGFSLSGSFG